jgi:DNA-binding response OmpR family regulator
VSEKAIATTLLIEDDDSAAKEIATMLDASNYFNHKIVTARTVAEASTFLRKWVFDLILLDLTLPNGKGSGLVIQIKVLAPETPLVVVTSLDNEEIEVECISKRAEEFIPKSIPMIEKMRRIRNVLVRRNAQKEFAKISSCIGSLDRKVDSDIARHSGDGFGKIESEKQDETIIEPSDH